MKDCEASTERTNPLVDMPWPGIGCLPVLFSVATLSYATRRRETQTDAKNDRMLDSFIALFNKKKK